MTTYYLEMRDGVCHKTREIEADSLEAAAEQAQATAEDWCADGEWDDGARIDVAWSLYADADCNETLDSGSCVVVIEPTPA